MVIIRIAVGIMRAVFKVNYAQCLVPGTQQERSYSWLLPGAGFFDHASSNIT